MTLTAARISRGEQTAVVDPLKSKRTLAHEWIRTHTVAIVVACTVVLGTALRLAAARCDLWLDEIWSLHLVAPLTSPDQVFWAISHDNNHFLNSMWMYAVGQKASPLIYRAPSIVFGAASILVAAHIGRRSNAAAAVFAALFVAVSYPCVDYGSEARGYGALILALLLAVDLILSLIEPAAPGSPVAWTCKPSARLRWGLGAAVALGACAHLTMVVGTAILGCSLLWMLYRGRTVPQALDATVEVFRPAMLLLLLLAVAIGAGVVTQSGFALGDASPFSLRHFVEGYGGLVAVLLGVPAVVPPWAALCIAACLFATLWAAKLVGQHTRVLLTIALVVVPALIAIARPSNVEFPRYFLAPGLFLLVAVAEGAGRAWTRGGVARVGAAVLVAAICFGQSPRLAALMTVHRGSPTEAVRLMAADGPATFEGAWPTAIVANYEARRLGLPVTPVATPVDCRAVATWLIFDSGGGEAVPDRPIVADAVCHARYVEVAFFPAALWSGRAWMLYRHEP